jgi:hypothetical protein
VKIRVQRRDGTIEPLTLQDPLTLQLGGTLHRIVTPDGTEHLFTRTGYYAGVRRSGQVSVSDAARLLRDSAECATCRDLLIVYQKSVRLYSRTARQIAGAAGADISLALRKVNELRRACAVAIENFDTHWRAHS